MEGAEAGVGRVRSEEMATEAMLAWHRFWRLDKTLALASPGWFARARQAVERWELGFIGERHGGARSSVATQSNLALPQ